MFDMAPSAPLEIGTIFTWDELFFPSDPATPNPFYPDFATCLTNAQEANPERGDYFGFQIQPMIDVPLPTENCFTKSKSETALMITKLWLHRSTLTHPM